jgi:hypothetical protein
MILVRKPLEKGWLGSVAENEPSHEVEKSLGQKIFNLYSEARNVLNCAQVLTAPSKLIPINHFHKPLPKLVTNGYSLVGDINMVVFYFAKLLIIDDV